MEDASGLSIFLNEETWQDVTVWSLVAYGLLSFMQFSLGIGTGKGASNSLPEGKFYAAEFNIPQFAQERTDNFKKAPPRPKDEKAPLDYAISVLTPLVEATYYFVGDYEDTFKVNDDSTAKAGNINARKDGSVKDKLEWIDSFLKLISDMWTWLVAAYGIQTLPKFFLPPIATEDTFVLGPEHSLPRFARSLLEDDPNLFDYRQDNAFLLGGVFGISKDARMLLRGETQTILSFPTFKRLQHFLYTEQRELAHVGIDGTTRKFTVVKRRNCAVKGSIEVAKYLFEWFFCSGLCSGFDSTTGLPFERVVIDTIALYVVFTSKDFVSKIILYSENQIRLPMSPVTSRSAPMISTGPPLRSIRPSLKRDKLGWSTPLWAPSWKWRTGS